jgi:anaerobic magnesium-protoporphyrin IX monomethyl ester cyclase
VKRLVLLINPKMWSARSRRLPLSLLSLAAVLEGRSEYRLIDGNVDPDPVKTARGFLQENPHAVIGVSVMPGPQVAPAIAISSALRAAHPGVPIIWGGFFPTLYADAAINAAYVDYLVRGQGEDTLLELLDILDDGPADAGALRAVRGLTWRDGETVIHNPERPIKGPDDLPPLPYATLGNVSQYLTPSFLGSRTGVHQAAIGCRYHCSFCGVVSMFNGRTRLPKPDRTYTALTTLRDVYGANAMQFFDNNFFDREETSLPVLDILGKMEMPWWCYARADTLANFPASTWEKIRKSRLRMTYIGAEAASDTVLKGMRKGTRVEHTLEVARRCREYGIIPEFSFILGGPEDPEVETMNTLRFIKHVKKINPDSEIILYFYSPTPQRVRSNSTGEGRSEAGSRPTLESYGPDGLGLPETPEEWTQKQWVDYVCHQDAPWLTPRMRAHIKDFARVLSCRYPTVQDYKTPAWGKSVLRNMARVRYSTGRYDRPWELDFARRLIPLREPQKESL